ncbi:MAG: radical SAM protein [Bacteroidales bacterium]|nr:radical SAM protein [Bacteroidales bacterium]
MECSVITTYRCNAHCQMCNIWQNPSHVEDEITPEIIDKLPAGLRQLKITGGEPMMREDIEDIIAAAYKKTSKVLIITNGYYTDKIINIAKKFPEIMVRISLDGLAEVNDKIRGIEDGFDHALTSALRLKELGVKDVGFSTVVSNSNLNDLLDLYYLSVSRDLEFVTTIKHNSFYFCKYDNTPENIEDVIKEIDNLIKAMLSSKRKNLKLRIKDWFRAYLNYGMLNNLSGESRPFDCGVANDSFFLDPYGKVLACNGSQEPWIMGDLKESDFDNIWNSKQAMQVRDKVCKCTRNCWMPHIVECSPKYVPFNMRV